MDLFGSIINVIKHRCYCLSLLNLCQIGCLLNISGARQRGFRQPIKDSLALFKTLLTRMPSNCLAYSPVLYNIYYVINSLRQDSAVIDQEIEDACTELKAIQVR